MACVVLFVLLVVGVLIARGRSGSHGWSEAPATPADYRIKEVHLSEDLRNGVRWQLEADSAEMYEGLGKTSMRKITITITQPERIWTLTGDEGDLVQATRDVELRGNVVVIASDGLRLETTRLSWVAQEQRAWTDDAVTIYRPGAVVRGRGLVARVADQSTVVKGRLRATFTGAPGGGSGEGQ